MPRTDAMRGNAFPHALSNASSAPEFHPVEDHFDFLAESEAHMIRDCDTARFPR
jgi:hypothetical protein